jgi:predicted small secreted protein
MKILSIVIALAVLLGLAACNTVRGMGQDLKKAGEKIEETVKK